MTVYCRMRFLFAVSHLPAFNSFNRTINLPRSIRNLDARCSKIINSCSRKSPMSFCGPNVRKCSFNDAAESYEGATALNAELKILMMTTIHRRTTNASTRERSHVLSLKRNQENKQSRLIHDQNSDHDCDYRPRRLDKGQSLAKNNPYTKLGASVSTRPARRTFLALLNLYHDIVMWNPGK